MTAIPGVTTGEYEKFRVFGERGGLGCQPFSKVFHGAHIKPAFRIVQDRKILCHTVSDESHLKDSDVRVVWATPFDWGTGSRYGCIQWTFNWSEVLDDMNVYWVESVTKYKYSACRFLLTDNTYKDRDPLMRYDPLKANGPWWFDADQGIHYQNRDNVCVEFMIERDLQPSTALSTEFVRHSDRFCCEDKYEPNNCWEYKLGHQFYRAGAHFLGRIIGADLDLSQIRITVAEAGQNTASDSLHFAWVEIRNKIWKVEGAFRGIIAHADAAAIGIARAILAAYGYGNYAELGELVRLFESPATAAAACADLIQSVFHLSHPLSLVDD